MIRTLSLALLVCTLSACAPIDARYETPVPRLEPIPARGTRHLAQLDFGHRARFAECFEPSCPERTVKTLATVLAKAERDGVQPTMVPATPVPADPAQATASAPSSPPSALSARSAPSESPWPSPANVQRLTLLFPLGSATLTDAHKSQLRHALPDLQHSERISLVGRTDDQGSDALNQSLALARGLAVRDYLIEIDPLLPARIAIDARGRCCYAAPNENDDSRARNRRVEIAYVAASGVAR